MGDHLASSSPRLAILGASVRAAVQSAQRAGFKAVAADLFADLDLRHVAPTTRITDYPEGVADWLDSVEADAWFYCGALENHPELVDALAQVKPLWGNTGPTLRGVRDYPRLCKALDQAGIAFPETRTSLAGLRLDGDWLAKTYRSSSGAGVWALDAPETVQRAKASGALFQRRLDRQPGVAASVVYVLGESRCYTLGISQQVVGDPRTGAGPFQFAGSLTPLAISDAVIEQLAALRRLLAGRFGLRGLTNVDLWIDEQCAWVLEVNPRYSASVEVLERATGVSALALHAAAYGDATVDLPVQFAPARIAAGKLVLFAKRDVVITTSFSDWALAGALDSPWPLMADIPAPGEAIPRDAPVLTLLAAGDEAAVGSLFSQRVAEVEKRLYAEA